MGTKNQDASIVGTCLLGSLDALLGVLSTRACFTTGNRSGHGQNRDYERRIMLLRLGAIPGSVRGRDKNLNLVRTLRNASPYLST